MNCPSRVDPDALPNGWNQSPSALALHKNNDLNGRANLRHWHDHRIEHEQPPDDSPDLEGHIQEASKERTGSLASSETFTTGADGAPSRSSNNAQEKGRQDLRHAKPPQERAWAHKQMSRAWAKAVKFSKFVGPGFMIAVAYIDPGACYSLLDAGETGIPPAIALTASRQLRYGRCCRSYV